MTWTVTSKISDIASAEPLCVNVNIIKFGKIYVIGSSIPENQIFDYTSTCIECDRIQRNQYDSKLNGTTHINVWNDEVYKTGVLT